jgi:hypothetical protein
MLGFMLDFALKIIIIIIISSSSSSSSSISSSSGSSSSIITMALEPFVGPWPLFQLLDPIHSWYDSLDGGSVRRKASIYTQNSTITE